MTMLEHIRSCSKCKSEQDCPILTTMLEDCALKDFEDIRFSPGRGAPGYAKIQGPVDRQRIYARRYTTRLRLAARKAAGGKA